MLGHGKELANFGYNGMLETFLQADAASEADVQARMDFVNFSQRHRAIKDTVIYVL